LIADGICLAGIWLLCLFLAGSLGDRLRGLKPGDPHPLSWLSLAFLTAALVLTMLGRERLGGATALVFWCAVMLADSGGPGDRWRAAFLVPAACFAALLLVPRAQPRDTRRLHWLGLVALIAVASSLSDDAVAAILVVALLTVVPLSLAVLHIDPRPAIASAICVSFFGIAMAQDPAPLGVLGTCFLIATPVVVVISVARTRRLNASHRAAT